MFKSFAGVALALSVLLWQPTIAHAHTDVQSSPPVQSVSSFIPPQNPQREQVSLTSCPDYTIAWGDTLSGIAQSNNKTVADIATRNNIPNPNLIYAGHTLCVNGDGSQPTDTQPAVTTAVSIQGPCQSGNQWGNGVGPWTVPSDCYGGVYGGVWYNGMADCFALVQYYTGGRVPALAYHSSPVIGAVMKFPPGNQGADATWGHWALVVGINSNGMLLILEQNNYWRGGYGQQTYRYVYNTGIYYY
jgi:hypothetical protein